jgi:hypothetical protein
MDIQIKPVRRSEFKFTDASEIQLVDTLEVKAAIKGSILGNPLNRGFIVENSDVALILNVTVGGEDYSAMVPWASIGFDSYLDSGSPVVLDFHLTKYLGDDQDYPFGLPSAETLMERYINWRILNGILLHEFSHFLDALDPEFEYSLALKKSLTPKESYRLQDFWNDYINCRLTRLIANENMVEIPKESSFGRQRKWTYPELVMNAKNSVLNE